MKKSLLYSSFIFALITFFGCGSGNKQIEIREASFQLSVPAVDPTKENDKKFLYGAVEIYFKEILLGKLAQRRASSEGVRELGKMLEEESRNAKSSLVSLSYTESMPVSSEPGKSAYAAFDTLNQVATEEFDVVYVGQVIQNHSEAIQFFENASREKHDPDIQKWISSMIPVLQAQLSKANELNAPLNPMSELVEK